MASAINSDAAWVKSAVATLQEYDLLLHIEGKYTDEYRRTQDYSGEDLTTKRSFKHTSGITGSDKQIVWWWNRKEKELRASGRVTDAGVLKIDWTPIEAWTLSSVSRAWEHLDRVACLAVLIMCNGVLEEKDMDSRELVVEVVREVVKQELHQMFGSLLTSLRQHDTIVTETAAPPKALGIRGRGLRRCSRCKTPGHTARTCKSEEVGG